MLSPACIRSKPWLMSSNLRTWVIIGSMAIRPSIYQSTIVGTSVRPRAPPNAVPFHTRPVTRWNGRVAISLPASATPMTTLVPQPRWDQGAARVGCLPVGEVGDPRVDGDPPVHIPVYDCRHVGAAASAAERGPLPHPAGDQLERPRGDLLAGLGDADDDAGPPAAVAAFERRAHDVGVAGAVEA